MMTMMIFFNEQFCDVVVDDIVFVVAAAVVTKQPTKKE
jgi:hypothetical protein